MVRVGHEDEEHIFTRGELLEIGLEKDVPPLALLPLHR